MSLFANDNTPQVEQEIESVGFERLSTDIYSGSIDMAYLTTADSGAQMLHVTFKTAQDRLVSVQECFRSGDAKGNKTYYTNKNNGKNYDLPGYKFFRHLLMAAAGLDIDKDAIVPEQRHIEVYDKEAGKKITKEMPVITQLVGKPVKAAIEHSIEDKTAKDAKGAYVPTGETFETNNIIWWFNAETDKAYSETVSGDEAAFAAKWLDKNQGKVKDNSDPKAKANAPASGSPVGNNAPAATPTLFNTAAPTE